MEIEELEDLNSVEMSNQQLLRVEASEIKNLQMAIANLLQLNQTLPFAESSKLLQRELNLSTPFDSFLESLTLVLQRKIAIHALRYALFAFLRHCHSPPIATRVARSRCALPSHVHSQRHQLGSRGFDYVLSPASRCGNRCWKRAI